MGAETLGQLIKRRRRAIAGIAGMLSWAARRVATIPGQASADPPGNNGTVKIDGVEFDSHPDNEPHVGCIFQVDWYGFDEDPDLFSQVTFQAWPPTGNGEELLTDSVFIGEDSNAGGGSEAGLDASRTYDLSTALAQFTPHPEQGFHVKLTIDNGNNDKKHKVFWVSGCETPPTTTSSTTSTTEGPTTSTTEEATTSTTEEETTSTTEEATTSTTEEETTSTTEGPTTSTTEEATTSTTEHETTTSTTEKPTTSTTEEETTSTTEDDTTSTTEEETTSTTEEETTSTTEEETTSTTEGSTTSSTEGSSTTAVAPSSTSTSMMGTPPGELPKTGGGSQGLLIAAGIIMLLGGGALLGSAKLSERRMIA